MGVCMDHICTQSNEDMLFRCGSGSAEGVTHHWMSLLGSMPALDSRLSIF